MALTELQVNGYRSVRRVRLTIKQINVLVGQNGCGKSNLYRALYLVCAAAEGTLARAIAEEGGLPSALWAGKRNIKEPHRIRIAVSFGDDTDYELAFGRIPISERPDEAFEGAVSPITLAHFRNDIDIKQESVTILNHRGKKLSLVNRISKAVSLRDMDGRSVEYPLAVASNESVLSGLREPHRFPELASLRQTFLNWRFYHQFRLDAASPVREAQIGVLTPVLAHDGSDLASALATIMAMDEAESLDKAFDEAFPGSRLGIDTTDGQFGLQVTMPGINRAFEAVELSDGTLQYLCLLAALISPRPPALLAINEPESSIHLDLIEPLARLIVRASVRSQLWITTHSRDLADAIFRQTKAASIELTKVDGETRIVGDETEREEGDGGNQYHYDDSED